MQKQAIHTQNAPAALGPYEQAVQQGNLVFTSGQLGIDPASGTLQQGIEAQAHQSLQNLGAILQQAGAGYQNVVKTTIFVQDLADFATVNEIYAQYFAQPFPARSCVQVAALPLQAAIEIEAIALV